MLTHNDPELISKAIPKYFENLGTTLKKVGKLTLEVNENNNFSNIPAPSIDQMKIRVIEYELYNRGSSRSSSPEIRKYGWRGKLDYQRNEILKVLIMNREMEILNRKKDRLDRIKSEITFYNTAVKQVTKLILSYGGRRETVPGSLDESCG